MNQGVSADYGVASGYGPSFNAGGCRVAVVRTIEGYHGQILVGDDIVWQDRIAWNDGETAIQQAVARVQKKTTKLFA